WEAMQTKKLRFDFDFRKKATDKANRLELLLEPNRTGGGGSVVVKMVRVLVKIGSVDNFHPQNCAFIRIYR
ncbi:MAG: hypothetical protein ACI391_06095, partial [Muribaculaceae bacterium]